MDSEQEKNKKDYIRFNLEFGDDISIYESLSAGRISIPGEDDLGNFVIYQPDEKDIIKCAYEGLFRIWEKQGKDPIQELKKLEKK